jgi:NAD(P)-dependent dehydrogenase (short-subunit alcohol dehydrogenase family)
MRVLVTGASGTIGRYLRARLRQPDRVLRLLDRAPLVAGRNEEVVQADITDLPAMTDAARDVDAVVHLAGIAGETEWSRILATNIDGTHNAIEAARRAGVPRFIFASSLHADGFRRRDQTDTTAPDYLFPSPDTYYGVSKVAGEALCALYHHRYAMDAVCVRIMSCRDQPINESSLATWLSPDDAGRLFEAALSTPSPGFRIVWGVSANTRAWFSMTEGSAIGYHPLDNAENYADDILSQAPPEEGTFAHLDVEAGFDIIGGALTTSFFDVDRLN